jgi:hypothetical protein
MLAEVDRRPVNRGLCRRYAQRVGNFPMQHRCPLRRGVPLAASVIRDVPAQEQASVLRVVGD